MAGRLPQTPTSGTIPPTKNSPRHDQEHAQALDQQQAIAPRPKEEKGRQQGRGLKDITEDKKDTRDNTSLKKKALNKDTPPGVIKNMNLDVINIEEKHWGGSTNEDQKKTSRDIMDKKDTTDDTSLGNNALNKDTHPNVAKNTHWNMTNNKDQARSIESVQKTG